MIPRVFQSNIRIAFEDIFDAVKLMSKITMVTIYSFSLFNVFQMLTNVSGTVTVDTPHARMNVRITQGASSADVHLVITASLKGKIMFCLLFMQ